MAATAIRRHSILAPVTAVVACAALCAFVSLQGPKVSKPSPGPPSSQWRAKRIRPGGSTGLGSLFHVAPSPSRLPRFPSSSQHSRSSHRTHSSISASEGVGTIHDEVINSSPLGRASERKREGFACVVDGRKLDLTYDVFGASEQAIPTLFLATPSFVPSRATFTDMASSMFGGDGGDVLPILTELPGYGLNDATLTDLDGYTPSFFRKFLPQLLTHLSDKFGQPIQVVSAGHAAFYLLDAVRECPSSVRSMFLLNPTYRGPLTTVKMKNKDNPVVPSLIDALCGGIAGAYKLPDPIGSAVHSTQCGDKSIRKAMLSHVYSNPANVTDQAVQINMKYAAQGERWGKVAFLTGRTDPYPRREDAVEAYGVEKLQVPTTLCVGKKEEDIFRKDLDFLTNSGVPLVVTSGAQRNFVEFPGEVAGAAREFFAKH